MEALLPCPFFLWIMIQDIRERRISVFLIAILFILALTLLGIRINKANSPDIAFNLLMLFIQLSLTIMSIKLLKGKNTKVIDHYLGLGDILVLFICGLCFTSMSFLNFYLCSLFLAILSVIIKRLFFQSNLREIPFAAVLSFTYIAGAVAPHLGIELFTPFKF